MPFIFDAGKLSSGRKLFTLPRGEHAPWQSEALDQLDMLPRILVLLIPKQPYVNWVRRFGAQMTPHQARLSDNFAYLIPTRENDPAEAEHFIDTYWQHFFAQALEAWEHSDARWPQPRTLKMFRQWFEVRTCGTVLDLGGYAE